MWCVGLLLSLFVCDECGIATRWGGEFLRFVGRRIQYDSAGLLRVVTFVWVEFVSEVHTFLGAGHVCNDGN